MTTFLGASRIAGMTLLVAAAATLIGVLLFSVRDGVNQIALLRSTTPQRNTEPRAG